MSIKDASSIPLKIIEALKFNGFRITKKRKKILDAMLAFNRPASADEIRIKADLPPSDIVTVYRNLEAFESINSFKELN